MNLIPIDTGGTPTDLIGGDASPGGDFAALITGLMTGDTQIVPLIDIPASEQAPEGADAAATDETTDVAASILEFIGTPPTGLTIRSPHDAPRHAVPGTSAELSIESEAVPVGPAAGAVAANPEAATTVDPADGPALATVHPIRTHMANAPSVSPETDTPVVGPEQIGRQPDAAAPMATDAGLEPAIATDDRGARPAAPPSTEAPRATPSPTGEVLAASTQRGTGPGTPPESKPEQYEGGTHLVESDVDADTGTAARPFEAARPGSSITQPAMVGIARRVEEAIAALATKPDPKIVTMQLDELDGLRLTVALRPDGIHLSSSGDATLTTEIERALASRGFDMASGSDRGRQGSEENTDDGWKPQPATPGRQPRTNQSGIRL